MPIEGTINSLYLDYEQTKPLFPRTKTKAVSDENGVGLDATLSKIQNDLSNKATESFVTNKIAEAQFGGGSGSGNIDLSGYATKDDLNNIDYPVDSVNGKTGVIQLNANDVGAIKKSGDTVTGMVQFKPEDGTSVIATETYRNTSTASSKTRNVIISSGDAAMQLYKNALGEEPSTEVNRLTLTETDTQLMKPLTIASGGTGATTADKALTNLGITATAAELNKLDGVTATTAELNYVDGVTSAIQTQLDGKQATISGGASTIASSNLTASRALISNSSGKVAVSAVTSTELGYLDGVTSAIQTQLNGKQATISGGASTIASSNLTASRALVSNSSGKVAVSAVTSTELGYLDGVTSAIQTQLNGKAPSGYGLGLTTGTLPQYSTVAQVNTLKSAGWYEYYNTSTPACDGYAGTFYGGILVIPTMWNITQIFFCREYYGGVLKRFFNDSGVWQPWEWINPPLLPNVEYRTTERYNGSSVFVKYISYGYLAAGSHTIAHGISGISTPVDMIIQNGIYGPVMGSENLHYGFDKTNVSLTLPWAAGAIGYVLKYTK